MAALDYSSPSSSHWCLRLIFMTGLWLYNMLIDFMRVGTVVALSFFKSEGNSLWTSEVILLRGFHFSDICLPQLNVWLTTAPSIISFHFYFIFLPDLFCMQLSTKHQKKKIKHSISAHHFMSNYDHKSADASELVELVAWSLHGLTCPAHVVISPSRALALK